VMGPVIPEEDEPGVYCGYRRIIVSPYMVFYLVLEDHIVMARVSGIPGEE